ncbi:MAG TPA: FtsW/RodA/SpoVE family cell cycle protein [Candidatus Hydrogenedentes bacterium]|nr:FtsW/RodA/SpoVE family cell cycle protein [Candidatus Hydrogenedentota bacterium]HPO84621.1 FtsW/RodA/SpoVE family cell cycle protein [Candidatus Hydrogenedentota bacterium]
MKKEVLLILMIVLVLVQVGILMVYSASIVRAVESSADYSLMYLLGQLIRVGLGVIAFAVGASFDYHRYKKRIILLPTFAFVTLLLLAVLFVEEKTNETHRWFTFHGISLQPSDFVKPLVIILLAVKLSENQKHIKSFWRGFVPPLATTLFLTFLIAVEPDIGTPFVIGLTALFMVMLAGASWLHLAQSGLAGVGLITLYVLKYPHALDRVKDWVITLIDPMKYRSDESYQLIQSLWAFAQGGVFGLGPGAGQQKLHYLYAAESDFIFSICGEELGLIGTLAIVFLFASFFIIGMRLAVCAPDLMGALLAAGIVFLITFQATVSMMVTTGLLPTKGITLPFISAGGTSLVTVLFLIGVLINVGIQSVKQEESEPIALCVQGS